MDGGVGRGPSASSPADKTLPAGFWEGAASVKARDPSWQQVMGTGFLCFGREDNAFNY